MNEYLYVAITNVPGQLPTQDPVRFFDIKEAWDHLATIRREEEDEAIDAAFDQAKPGDTVVKDGYSGVVNMLDSLAEGILWDELPPGDVRGVGSITGPTPGYDGDNDLGVAYEVQAVSLPARPSQEAYAKLGEFVAAVLGANLEWDSAYMEYIASAAERFGFPNIGGQGEEELALWRIVADEVGVEYDDDWND